MKALLLSAILWHVIGFYTVFSSQPNDNSTYVPKSKQLRMYQGSKVLTTVKNWMTQNLLTPIAKWEFQLKMRKRHKVIVQYSNCKVFLQ